GGPSVLFRVERIDFARLSEALEQGTSWMAVLKKLFTAQRRDCAVCIPDGAQLTLHGISLSLRKIHGLSATERVTFRQLSADAEIYRDAVEFTNGVTVLLQELEEGQRVEVLALSAENVVIKDTVEICEEAVQWRDGF